MRTTTSSVDNEQSPDFSDHVFAVFVVVVMVLYY